MSRGAVAAALALGAAAFVMAAPASALAAAPSSPDMPANIAVTPADGRDYQQPSLALDPGTTNHVALAYQDGATHELCGLALSRDGGRTWSARALVGTGGAFSVPEGFAACWNPSVAYGTSGTLYYLFQTSLLPSNPYSHVLLAVSHDGGATFDAPHAVDPSSPVYPGKRAGGDWWPSMAVDRQRGVVYVTWSRFTPELDSSGILVAASHDRGQTFSAPIRLSGALEHDVTGSQAAVAPDGTLFVDWFDYTPSERGLVECDPTVYTSCPDWGVSSYGLTTEQMDTGLLGFYHDEGSRLDFAQGLGCEGYVSPSLFNTGVNYYTYIERGGSCMNPGGVRVAASTDGGRTAQELSPPGTTVDTGCSEFYTAQPPPSPPDHACTPTHYSIYDHNVVAAATGVSGEDVAAWWGSEGEMAQAPSRLSIALSVDGGRHWHTRTPVGAAGHIDDMQHRPALSIAPDGRLDVVYYELTQDGAQDVYAVSAENPRRDFSSSVRISSRSSNSAVGPIADDNRASFGDHLAAVSTNEAILAAWTDARAQHQGISFARVPVALVTASSAAPSSSIAVIAVVVLAVLTVLGGAGAMWLLGIRRARRRPRAVASAVATERQRSGEDAAGEDDGP